MTFRGRAIPPLGMLAVLGLAMGPCTSVGHAAEVSGLYRDGQLVDTLGTNMSGAVSGSGAAPLAPVARASGAARARRAGAPPVSAATQERNRVFAVAARRALKVRRWLQRLQAAEPGAARAQHQALRKLSQLDRLYRVTEPKRREVLAAVGARVTELGLDPAISRRHAKTVEAFERGTAAFTEAIRAVLRGEDGAVARALTLMEDLQFRPDPPLLSTGLPLEMHVEEAPRVEHQPAALDRKQPQPVAIPLPQPPPPPSAADLAETVDIQLTPEIQSTAAALGNSPLEIYEFVRNHVEFQPYLGSRKGSAETLKELRGNDTDQASLLLALLRAAGIPSRYVRGTVEIDAERAKSWLGVDDASTAANILTTADLDGVAIVNGPSVVAVRLTHVWVEAFVPYANYRGVPNDTSEQSWVPLDPSFKGTQLTPGSDVLTPMGFNADAFLTDYISTFHTPSPLEKLAADVQAYLDVHDPGTAVADIERTTSIAPQVLGLLPASLPYTVRSISDRLSELEDTKRYKVRFHLYDGGTDFIDYTIPLPQLIGKRPTIQYVGATAADQAAIDGFGGIYNTPPNLVDVKPLLKLDNVAVATATNGIGMGQSHSFDMEFLQPAGESNTQPLVQNQIIAGNGEAIGFDTFLDVGNTLIDDPSFPPEVFLESTLYTTALDYLNRVDRGQEQAQRLMAMVSTQDVSEAIVENAIAVSFSFGIPVTFEWTGLLVDADRRIVGPFAADGDSTKTRPYMIVTGMDGSIMENRVFEDRFAQQAVSTVKILELASDAAIPICTVTSNIAADCPGTTQPAFIQNAVNAAAAVGHVVTIPKAPITVGMWSGTGYIDMQPATGAAGYIIGGGISGGIQPAAGGATVDQWPINLTCEATAVTGQVLQPPADAPDPSAVFCADDTTITFVVRLTTTCKDGSMQVQDVTLVTHKTKKQIGPGNYDLQLVAFGTTTIRRIVIVGVEIMSADVRTDTIAVRLSPDGLSGPLRLRLTTPATHVIREEPRASGTYNESFAIPSLAVGEYTKVDARWTIGSLSCSTDFDYHIRVLGMYRHSRYNIPAESACTGAPTAAFVTNASCAFTPTMLKSDFLSQVNLNGSGVSLNHGNLGREFFCTGQPGAPPGSAGISFRTGTVFHGGCSASAALDNTTVAVLPGHPFLGCGDHVFLNTVGEKTITDFCPGCAQMQLDNFTTNGACAGITDLGNFMTIKLF